MGRLAGVAGGPTAAGETMTNGSHGQAEKLFARGTLIFEEGEPGQNMYFIVDGGVEIFRGDGEDKEILAILSKAEFFGEMALIDAKPRIASARAVTNVKLIAVSRHDFNTRLDTADPFVRAVLRVLTAMVRDLSPAPRS